MPASKPVNTPGEIDLTGKALTTLPTAPAEHAALEVLWLDRNRLEMLPLTALPAWLAGFTRLEKLDLRRNRLDPVPGWIDRLRVRGCIVYLTCRNVHS